MKRVVMLATLTAFILFMFGVAQAETEIRMSGSARISANWYSNYHFTGWNTSGSGTVDPVTVWQRFRFRTDFIANESLKFRLRLKIEDVWGHGTFTADNSAAAVRIDRAYLMFKWPNTDIEITAGYQPFGLPQSSFYNASPIFGDSEAAALVLSTPLIEDTLAVKVGFVRFLDNGEEDSNTTQVADELDAYFLTLPITLDGISITPWGMVAVAGVNANYTALGEKNGENLLTAGSYVLGTGWKNNQNAFWWAGAAFEVDALDPFSFYADVIFGQGAVSDRESNSREGWFIDGAVEYTGFDMLTPQLFAWWSSGEDGSTRNGSERIPYVLTKWNASNSFLYDGGQIFKNANAGVSPIGSWGITASLNDISFIEKLSHRLTFTYARGTNSKTALRDANIALGTNSFFVMGRDLAVDEYVLGVAFDHKYMIYENLALVAETGWAHGEFDKSVWGSHFYDAAGDMWKVSLGLKYTF